MSENTTDAILIGVVGCRAGERDSQCMMHVRLAFTVWLCGWSGKQDAADVTQQTFLRAFSHLDQYEGSARFATWLYRLAVNESLQHQHRRR